MAFGRGPNPARVAAILEGLQEAYPEATCELKYDNAFQLLISTILSAQCTDVVVNQVTEKLFQEVSGRQSACVREPRRTGKRNTAHRLFPQ